MMIIFQVLFMGKDHEGVTKGKMPHVVDWKSFFRKL